MNLIVNYCYGNKLFDNFDFNIYLESLDKIDNTTKVLLITNCDKEKVASIAHHYDAVLEFFREVTHIDELIYNFVSACSDQYEYIIISDARDVIFQKNPFDYMIENGKNLYMISEGMQIRDSIPNYNWVFNLMKSQRDNSENIFLNQVVNGGVFGGKIEHVMMLLLLSITNCNRNSHEPVYNQPVYSFLENFLTMTKFVEICKPSTSLFCITGEGVLRHGVPMKIVDGLACNETEEPYYIIHQWDRTFFAEEVRSRYLEGQKE